MGQADLHSVVHSYLATLLAISDAVGEACPAVGGPHQQRLSRLRTRLSFDSNTPAVEASAAIVREELRDFAAKSSSYVALGIAEWKHAAEAVRDTSFDLLQKQRFYASRIRAIAAKIEPAHGAQLLTCAESMQSEAQSALASIEELLAAVEARLVEAESVDRATGLMNRREMDRRLELRRAAGLPILRLLFSIRCQSSPEDRDGVLRRVAARLTGQTRPGDLVARWGDREFLILFDGPEEVAERRGGDLAGMLTTAYPLENGTTVDVQVSVQLLDRRPPIASDSVLP